MLATTSTVLNGTETFEEAFSLIPEKQKQIRYLKTENNESTGVFQLYNEEQGKWSSPRMMKQNIDGTYSSINLNTKKKLEGTSIFYDVFDRPTHAGGNEDMSWLIGDIDHCSILNEDYNVQGLIISNIFDPTPKYYLSFERLVCENQMGSLGTSNSSMYIDMNKFIYAKDKVEAKDKLISQIYAEIEKRTAVQKAVYDKLLSIKLTDERVSDMFKKLTVDKVAKDSPQYQEQEKRLYNYEKTYDCNDNQNYKGTFMGFVNTCTNINTREKTNPLDVVKPIIPPQLLVNPCNLEYLYRDVLVHAS